MNPPTFRFALVLTLIGCLPPGASAQGGGDLNPHLKIPQESLERWRELRVGTFIHWSATYWTTDEGVTDGWLEYDLGQPRSFSRAILDEGDDGWIRHVQIQVKAGDEWKNAFEYRHGEPELWRAIPIELFRPEFRFSPVTAQAVRVKIVSAIKSPVVREFRLYAR